MATTSHCQPLTGHSGRHNHTMAELPATRGNTKLLGGHNYIWPLCQPHTPICTSIFTHPPPIPLGCLTKLLPKLSRTGHSSGATPRWMISLPANLVAHQLRLACPSQTFPNGLSGFQRWPPSSVFTRLRSFLHIKQL